MHDKSRRMPGHGRIVGLRIQDAPRPVYIRLGTSDLWVFHEIFLDLEYAAVKAARPAGVRTIVDLGSNIGLSVRYWRTLYPEAAIVAVEPDAANMAVCRRNAAAAGGPETLLVQACVAGSRRAVSLDRSAPAWAFKIREAGDPAASSDDRIDALTMTDILDQAGIVGEIDLLKCDIEGAEAEVFAHCGDWIRRVRTLIVELHAPYTRDLLLRDLAAGGFAGKVSSLKQMDGVHVLMIERDTAPDTSGGSPPTNTLGVSILIPTHNRGSILDRTLDSLALIRRPAGVAVEVVVVANACTDDTERRISTRTVGFPMPLRCVTEPVVGLGAARNACVRNSTLDICALLDDDVWVEPDWLEGLVSMYTLTPASMVAGRAELWWEAVPRPEWITPLMEMSLSGIDLGSNVLEMRTPDAVGANFSFRRAVFDEVGPFRTDLDRVGAQLLGGGDTYFIREALRRGHRLFYAPGASVKHWVAPHRVGDEYLAGVTFGSSYANVIMKERYGPLDAARSISLGLARMVGFAPIWAWAAVTGNAGLRVLARTRRAAGRGQLLGALARLRNGPLGPGAFSPLR
jgi:FkbM family methyltransferase